MTDEHRRHEPSRGPDALELALNRLTRAKIAARHADQQLGRAIDELRTASAEVSRLEEDDSLTPEFVNASRIRAGAALWDREPIDAAPTPRSLKAVR